MVSASAGTRIFLVAGVRDLRSGLYGLATVEQDLTQVVLHRPMLNRMRRQAVDLLPFYAD